MQGGHKGESPFSELQRRLGISIASSPELHVDEEFDDKELLKLSSTFTKGLSSKQDECIQVIALY